MWLYVTVGCGSNSYTSLYTIMLITMRGRIENQEEEKLQKNKLPANENIMTSNLHFEQKCFQRYWKVGY